jgi:hypothetical protein
LVRKLSFSLGKYTKVLQAEVCSIKACAVENLARDYKNRNIYILSDSQAAIETLGKYQLTSKLSGIESNPSYNLPNITEFT